MRDERINDWLMAIESSKNQAHLTDIFAWINKTYPQLEDAFKWRMAQFLDHGVFIIGFDVAKKWITIALEDELEHFATEIDQVGYYRTAKLMRIGENQSVDYQLLAKMIEWQLEGKRDIKSFWRPKK
jgi:Uncharacterized conserved protein